MCANEEFTFLRPLGTHNEGKRSNMIMGDMSDTLEILLAPDGLDYDMLTPAEKKAHDISRLAYTEDDKKVLRHFEAMSKPAMRLTKFLQESGNAVCWYVLYETKLAIQDTSAVTTPIYADISRMDRTKDLRKRGEKTVLIKTAGTNVIAEISKNYTRVETMHPLVERYCTLYTEDLKHRVGLNETYLAPSLTIPVLLNPLYGKKSKIVGSGLLSEAEYNRARGRESGHAICSRIV